ncbi:sugar phosphate isomerase/epimerase family protein, partial [Planctomycetota bacterium]
GARGAAAEGGRGARGEAGAAQGERGARGEAGAAQGERGARGERGAAAQGGRGGAAAEQPEPEPLSAEEELLALQASNAEHYIQLAKCIDLRTMYNEAGMNIHLHKMGVGRTEEAFDWSCNVAKALGAIGMTLERIDEERAKLLGPWADKNKIWVVNHNHTSNYPVMETMDPILQYGEYIGFNFDIGHYVAGSGGKDPREVIEKYHDRIISIHLKDRTADGGNLPWGQGETPIAETLQLIRDERWPIFCDIELEYQVPEGSDSVQEVAKCVRYCRDALLG